MMRSLIYWHALRYYLEWIRFLRLVWLQYAVCVNDRVGQLHAGVEWGVTA